MSGTQFETYQIESVPRMFREHRLRLFWKTIGNSCVIRPRCCCATCAVRVLFDEFKVRFVFVRDIEVRPDEG